MFLVESIVPCRPVKEGFMDITAIFGATFGMLAIVTILFVLIYFGRKKRKIFCNKHSQKGKIIFFKCDWYFEL